MLAESLERRARRDGRWRDCHQLCAEAIGGLYADRAEETARRRAEHLIEAGCHQEALEPLLEAARRAEMLGAYREHRQLIDRRREPKIPISVSATA
ncbi:MAG: hypothetical protein ABEN55_23705 [Bradymonadaceae bacterium]